MGRRRSLYRFARHHAHALHLDALREVAGDGGMSRPYVAKWAVRSAAVAAAAAAQGVLLVAVVGRVYARRGALDDVLRLSALLVFTVATVSAVALGLAGR